ncbi:hypothetical protein JF50_11495 [Pseudoalteromonas luteoviolacea]|uniref:Uncharacterized protein n=1 Tax=Pseudoalteromonas luteoviolacea TaxID=43657 RepID=A0A0C1QNB9_9GAMM|nr:hypothetical protein JF50_11495 [Pseudoalteromonas luteoviolacea]
MLAMRRFPVQSLQRGAFIEIKRETQRLFDGLLIHIYKCIERLSLCIFKPRFVDWLGGSKTALPPPHQVFLVQ